MAIIGNILLTIMWGIIIAGVASMAIMGSAMMRDEVNKENDPK